MLELAENIHFYTYSKDILIYFKNSINKKNI